MKSKNNNLLLGIHISIADGIENSIKKAHEIGCTAIQIFTASNRSFSEKIFSSEAIEKITLTQKHYNLPIISHCSYLINLASPNKIVNSRSYKALVQELKRCASLNIKYAVLHPGAHLKSSKNDALKQVAFLINEAIAEANSNITILLETMAGQGTSVGGTFEELAYIKSFIHEKKFFGICADTCHLFAQGYDFRTIDTYKNVWDQFDKLIGLDFLKVFHLNDSKKEFGSHVDRHEHIGKGKIGLEAFKLIMNDEKFENVIKILETPKETINDDIMNLNSLKMLLKKK